MSRGEEEEKKDDEEMFVDFLYLLKKVLFCIFICFFCFLIIMINMDFKRIN